MTFGDLHRPLTARRLQHGVPRPLDRLYRGADAAVLVDEEDGLGHGVSVDSAA